MRKLWYLFLVVLLTACGGGGGGGSDSSPTASPTGLGTLTVAVNQPATGGVAMSAFVFTDPEPQTVRVVVTRTDDPTFKRIEDVPLGTVPTFILPVTDGSTFTYTVDAIAYARTGALRRMLQYGQAAGVLISEGASTDVGITGTPIAPSVAGSLPATVYAGDTEPVTPPTGVGAPLQAAWYLSLKTSDYTTRPHLPTGTVPAEYTDAVMPTATDPGTLFVQGEFFIDPIYLQTGDVATTWVVNSPTVEIPLMVHGGTIGGGIFADTFMPHVTSLNVAAVTHSATGVTVTIGATDNVRVAGYQITETATPPAFDNGLWQPTNSFSYSFSGAPLTSGDSVTLWAWAMDPSNNVSGELVSKTVTYDNMPTIQSFTGPAGVQINPDIPLTITAASYDAGGLVEYCVTEDSTGAACVWTPWTAAAGDPQALTYNYTGPVTAATTTVSLYAWVGDANGDSAVAQTNFQISSAPKVTAFTYTNPVAASTTVTGINLTGDAFAPATIDGFLITETGAKPDAVTAPWSGASPATYDYVGTLPAGDSTKTIFGWVRDSAGNVSAPRIVYVRFTGMP